MPNAKFTHNLPACIDDLLSTLVQDGMDGENYD